MHKLCVHCFEILALTAKQARKASQILVYLPVCKACTKKLIFH